MTVPSGWFPSRIHAFAQLFTLVWVAIGGSKINGRVSQTERGSAQRSFDISYALQLEL